MTSKYSQTHIRQTRISRIFVILDKILYAYFIFFDIHSYQDNKNEDQIALSLLFIDGYLFINMN